MEKEPVEKRTVLDNEIAAEKLRHGSRFPVHLVLDNFRSAFNIGSAFRTADASCAEKIHLCGISAVPPHKEVEKTALGATQVVPWEYHSTTLQAIEKLKQQKIAIGIVELTSRSVSLWEYDFPAPIALVFGNEVTGVSDNILSHGDSYIHIPMYGKKTTLNVATSLGVVLFEVLRQWKNTHPELYQKIKDSSNR